MPIAITRPVSASVSQCELTHLERTPIDYALAQAQHLDYESKLVEAGCQLLRLPAEHDLPDAVFVEDTAIVLDEVAVITRPGAASRQPETAAVAHALAALRPLLFISAPGALDGGDVLRVGKRLFVGRSGRSNDAGIAQLAALLAPFGYSVQGVNVTGCLHLKSAVSQVSHDTLLINPAWVDGRCFGAISLIEVAPDEPHAGNALWLNNRVIYPNAHVRTRTRLQEHGIDVHGVDASELAKAEGGVTCCSLIVA